MEKFRKWLGQKILPDTLLIIYPDMFKEEQGSVTIQFKYCKNKRYKKHLKGFISNIRVE